MFVNTFFWKIISLTDPPPYNQNNPPYPPYPGQQIPGYQMPQNPGMPQAPGWGFQQPQPNVGFHMPPPQGFIQPPQDQGGYDPNNKPYDDNYVAGMGFDDKSIRAGFIKRVYSILTVSFALIRKYNKNFKK